MICKQKSILKLPELFIHRHIGQFKCKYSTTTRFLDTVASALTRLLISTGTRYGTRTQVYRVPQHFEDLVHIPCSGRAHSQECIYCYARGHWVQEILQFIGCDLLVDLKEKIHPYCTHTFFGDIHREHRVAPLLPGKPRRLDKVVFSLKLSTHTKR